MDERPFRPNQCSYVRISRECILLPRTLADGLELLHSKWQPFAFGIQTEWQLGMMAKFGHNNTLSIDATFGTSQTRVRHILCVGFHYMFFCSMSCHSICEYFLFMIDWFFRETICLWQYPLYTIMVFDNWRNGIPIVFLVISCTQEHGLILVLRSVHDRVTRLKKNWHPSSIVVDNTHAEINTLRYSLIFFIWWLCFQSCPSCVGVLIVSCMCRLVWPNA